MGERLGFWGQGARYEMSERVMGKGCAGGAEQRQSRGGASAPG